MSFKEDLNRKLIVIAYHLTTEEMLEARRNRNWEAYDEMEEVEQLQHQLEELSMYEGVLEDITEETMQDVMNDIYNRRF